jgi:hypothetical protein
MTAAAALTGSDAVIDICSCGTRYTAADILVAPGCKRVKGYGTIAYYWWDCSCGCSRCAIERNGEIAAQPSVAVRASYVSTTSSSAPVRVPSYDYSKEASEATRRFRSARAASASIGMAAEEISASVSRTADTAEIDQRMLAVGKQSAAVSARLMGGINLAHPKDFIADLERECDTLAEVLSDCHASVCEIKSACANLDSGDIPTSFIDDRKNTSAAILATLQKLRGAFEGATMRLFKGALPVGGAK